ncbi:MAG: hypothetical protein LUQ07_02850 [Methanospirillum sp.]|nr:hypothetical protein [Methanospirillum sp.]
MASLFLNMVKEEWRIHSTMFGSLNFALFPVLIFGIAFMGTFLLPLISTSLPGGELVIIIHASYLMFGFMICAFGLIGNEIMSRQFGEASLLAYAARILPLDGRYILSIFVIKDILYYFVFWILPLGAGFLLGSLFTGIPAFISLKLMLTVTLSFMTGVAFCFLFSSLYERSQPALILLLVLSGAGILLGFLLTGINPAQFFPPLLTFTRFSLEMLIFSLAGIIIPFVLALLLFSPETTSRSSEHPDLMKPMLRFFSGISHPSLVVKDLLDLWRSGILVGQMIFSFIIPLLIIWFFLSLLIGIIAPIQVFCTFAAVTGIIASTMYTWLSISYNPGFYAMLPVRISSVIKSKILCFTLLQPVPAYIIVIMALVSGNTAYLLPVLVLTFSLSYFGLSVTIRLTGLTPNEMLYHVRVMGLFLLLIGSAVSIFTAVSFTNPWYALSSAVLFIPAYYFVRTGCRRWESLDEKNKDEIEIAPIS